MSGRWESYHLVNCCAPRDSKRTLKRAKQVAQVYRLNFNGFTDKHLPTGADQAVGLRGLDAVYGETFGDPRIRVAVLDGPVDTSHPCFRGARLTRLPTLVPGNAKKDGAASQHGTHVTSIIFGQPGTAASGIAPSCSGIIVPVFADGAGGAMVMCSQLDLARAILQAVESGAHVINISGGQLVPTGEPEPVLAKAILTCADHNVLVVAAAGNDGCECLHVPAAVESVLSVGAMDARGEPLGTSNWGESYRTQGILAPGDEIVGAVPGGGIGVKSGTSFAAPIVSGLAGLLLSIQLKRGEKPDPHAVRAALLKSATPCNPAGSSDCRRFLAGKVNVEGALNVIVNVKGGTDMNDVTGIDASETPQVITADQVTPEPMPPAVLPAGNTAAAEGSAVSASEVSASDAAVAAAAPVLPQTARRPALPPERVTPSECACGGGANCTCGTGQAAQLVYALGKLGYDFGSEARRDSFIQSMEAGANNPHDPQHMARYLDANDFEAESLIWTLNLDATPIYAIVPAGPFASHTYKRLLDAFRGQTPTEPGREVELVSVPGVIAGSTRLQSGQVVPVIVPAVRGIYAWAMAELIRATLGETPAPEQAAGIQNFLSRVYYDLRNLGVTAQERALNYSATNAFQVGQVMEAAARGGVELDRIDVKKSPVCRPDSDCYDIELGFFSPQNTNIANRVFRFTVDVSDIIPVTIGEVRAWSKRA
jgi:cyanobactin maturation PatA/PatG family protease